MTAPVSVQTWILDEDHAIATWYEATVSGTLYHASCKCGVAVQSTNGAARNSLVEAHVRPILDAQRAQRP